VDQRIPIGRLLVERGIARLADVESAATTARLGDSRLCSKLLEAKACDEGDLVAVLAELHGVPGIDLSRTVVDLAALEYIPQAVAEADLLLPISMEGGRLHLAVASPTESERVVSEVRFVTGREVSIYVVVLQALRSAISSCYDAWQKGTAVWRGLAAAQDAGPCMAVRMPPPPEAPEAELTKPIVEDDFEIVAEAPAEEVVHAVAVHGGPRRVLVVDDEPAIRLLVQRALEHRGFAVETAQNGAEALEVAARGGHDLVLLDAMLPKLHGFEVARRLRADPSTRRIPIIIMTAVYRGWRFAQDARDSFGAEDYVEKPFRVDDLLRRIDAVLESRPQPLATASAPLLERGRAALGENRLAEAAAAFEEAVRLDPFAAEAYVGLGEVLRAQGELFQAMSALERALELRPALLTAMRTLAALYLEKGFRSKAAEVLERAVGVARDPETRERLRQELMPLL
jgi:DNA-binding response OmpR family regulator